MRSDDATQDGNGADHAGRLGWLRKLGHTLLRAIRFFNPWPGLTTPPDELMEMLTREQAESRRRRCSMLSFEELLELHRRWMMAERRDLSSRKWII